MSAKHKLVTLWASIERISRPVRGHGEVLHGRSVYHAGNLEAQRVTIVPAVVASRGPDGKVDRDDKGRPVFVRAGVRRRLSRREARIPARKAES
jgi:hypothetical protein